MYDIEVDFVTYGNALEPLNSESFPRKKPIIIEDQFAYDKQGRRRFHGAFTGGFSAGYFNTVGTRDGWQPQQFNSTRSKKAENIIQHPENFMDEEDIGEFGIAPSVICTTKEYSNEIYKCTKRERSKHDSSEPIPGTPVLKELLKPVGENIGVLILRKMGWKPGQGIGPRLTKQEKKQKRLQEKFKIYDCNFTNKECQESGSDSESTEDEYANISFAPDDNEVFRGNQKKNYFGIGYSGLNHQPILTEHKDLFETPAFSLWEKNKKFCIRGQAFGVGAFEIEDDDIYAKEDMSRYDFTLEPQEKFKNSWSQKKMQKMEFLEGFVPSQEQQVVNKIFEVPNFPKYFQPIHKLRKNRYLDLVGKNESKETRYDINTESRVKIINNDKPSNINSKSDNSNVSKLAKNVIDCTVNLFTRENQDNKTKLEFNNTKNISMSWLDKLSSTSFIAGSIIESDTEIKGRIQDLSTFSKKRNKMKNVHEENLTLPKFIDDTKQQRFNEYQKFSEADRKIKFSSIQPLSMTEWEKNEEITEFETITKLYEKNKVLVNDCEDRKKNTTNTIQYIESMNLNDRVTAAAKMKMFGKFTRIESQWKPMNLVCVRFNVAEPSIDLIIDNTNKKFSIFDSQAWNKISNFNKENYIESLPTTSASFKFCYTKKNPSYKIKKNMKKNLSELKCEFESEKNNCSENRNEKTLKKYEKINESFDSIKMKNFVKVIDLQEKKDLYKSIFLSSSEDSESESTEEKNINNLKLKTALIGKSGTELNIQKNNSPRGIFAKLNLDCLLNTTEETNYLQTKCIDKYKQIIEIKKIEDSEINLIQKEQVYQVKMDNINSSIDIYGPVLPKVILQSNMYVDKKSMFSGISKKNLKINDFHWVEKSNNKKLKKEKKKHKHKKLSKSKSKKKLRKEKKY